MFLLRNRISRYGSVSRLAGLAAVGTGFYYYSDLQSSGIVRFGRAAVAAAIVGFDYKLSLRGLDKDQYDAEIKEVHLRSAVRLRDVCCQNGGCFIKVGQHVGSLSYLLPDEYTRTLRVLHDRAPQSKFKDIKKVIREDLGLEMEEIFSSFDPEPLGAASLAQVHKAVLKDTGKVVAVKIQHPKVRAHSAIDMATMEFLIGRIKWLFPGFQFGWIAEETRRNLPLELDFILEADNCEKVAKMFSSIKFLKIPSVYRRWTTHRVLTMSYESGGKVTDKEYLSHHAISSADVARKLGAVYGSMVFDAGFVHCDPHPGNILVRKGQEESEGGWWRRLWSMLVKGDSWGDGNTEIVLLDHGLYTKLSDEFRGDYSSLWLSIVEGDMNGMEEACRRLHCGDMYALLSCIVSGRSWVAIREGLGSTQFTKEEDTAIRENAAQYLPEISEILNSIPREMLLLLKTNDLLRGIETTLGTRSGPGGGAHLHSLTALAKHCVRAVYKRRRQELFEESLSEATVSHLEGGEVASRESALSVPPSVSSASSSNNSLPVNCESETTIWFRYVQLVALHVAELYRLFRIDVYFWAATLLGHVQHQ